MMKNKIIFGIVIMQIILLLGMTFADSYQINQIDRRNEVSGVSGNFKIKDTLKNSLNLLFGFLAIKQIAIVSAAQAGGYCCEKTKIGAYCQNAQGQVECDLNYQNSPTTCDQTTYCAPGCCYDPNQGICLAGAPEKQCKDSGGEWKPTCEEESRCGKGCCLLGRNTQFTTRAHCRIVSEFQGAQVNFDPAMTEEDCKYYSPEEGACLIGDGSCRRTTEEECKGIEGDFNKGYLCSYFDSGAGCKKTDHIACSDKENQYDIYWFDSCGNRENIYFGSADSQKEASWNQGKIREKSSGHCDSTGGGDCGVCNYEGGVSICAESKSASDSVKAGDYYCKPLDCKDPYDQEKERKNGESWCVYDGKSSDAKEGWVGSNLNDKKNQKEVDGTTLPGVNDGGFYGRDAVGAGHFLRYCDQGEIKTDPCGTGDRGEICAEIKYNDQDGTMRAQCRTNLWFTCFNFATKEDCVASPNVDCRWQGVDVDDGFKFGACVPKFPKGFNLKADQEQQTSSESNAGDSEGSGTSKEQDLCSLGSQECKMLYVKECGTFVGSKCEWKCKVNCECQHSIFVQQMNQFCVSLGDCGGFYNIEGDFTKDGIGVNDLARDSAVGNLKENIKNPSASDENIVNSWDITTNSKEEQTTPMWIPIDSEEGTYGDLKVQGELDPNLKTKLDSLNLALKVFGSTEAVGGLMSFGFMIMAAKYGAVMDVATESSLFDSASGSAIFYDKMAGYAGGVSFCMMGGQLLGMILRQAGGSSWGNADAWAIGGAIIGLAVGIGFAIGFGEKFAGFFVGASIPPLGPILLGVMTAYMTAQTIWTFTNGNGDTKEKIVKFQCMPWEPPISTGDKMCGVCNENKLGTPCTKYKCNSLGSGCDLIDQQGTSAENPDPNNGETVNNNIPEINNPVCVDTGKCNYGAGNPPERELSFVSSGFKIESQTQSGATVKRENGDTVVESDIINLTLSTKDYSFCKYNYYKRDFATFDAEGELFNEGNYHTLNHTLAITIPWIEDERVANGSGNELRLYVRCIDKCDANVNVDEYIVSFPINPSPDTTAPMILNVTPADPSYLPFGVNQSYLRVTTNEEAFCKYDFNQGIQYMFMGGNFTKGPDSENGEEFYSEGIVSNLVGNSTTIYIKCQDQHGNNQTEDTPHTFLPTLEELKITDYKPEKDYTRKKQITTEEPLIFSVTTSGGAFEGITECMWEMKGATVASDLFLQNQSTTHEYPITSQLNAGEHELTFRCVDKAFNIVNLTTNFAVEDDKTPPFVVRVFIEGSDIKILTNENARCFYNTTYVANCNFDEGTGMDSDLTTEHTLTYKYDQTYYIKCKDEFNNQNTKCAVIIKPEVF